MANHTARQTYISAAMAMAQAAELQIDSTPMEGFNNAGLDELLELGKLNLKSQMLLALGYRDIENDWNLKLSKYRKPLNDLIVEL
jgi:nitroreductase